MDPGGTPVAAGVPGRAVLGPEHPVFHVRGDDPAPAYVQLERQIRVAVADGTLSPGDHLPSVRGLAQHLSLSTNTVGRAYADLAREGIILARAGGGSEVAPRDLLDQPALARLRRERLATLARQVVVRGLALGLAPAEITRAVEQELAARGHTAESTGGPELGSSEGAVLSARNALRGRVVGLRNGEVVSEVTLALPSGGELVVAVTRVSAERLALRPGAGVTAYVKATEVTLGP